MSHILVLALFLWMSMAQIGQANDIDALLKQQLRLTTTKTTLTNVIDGQTIIAEGDRVLHLPAIFIPWETPQSQGKYGLNAKQFLENHLKGKSIRLYQVRNNDRALKNAMGHDAVYIARADDVWFAQGELVRAGLAFAYPTQSHFAVADILYNMEEQAKADKVGLWADDAWQIHNPESVQGVENQFVIVEGKIKNVASRHNIIYLNFGDNWRDDFTVAMDSGLRREFSKAGMNVMDLGGKAIRARGWVREYNGAFMEIFHPSQIEVLTQSPLPQE